MINRPHTSSIPEFQQKYIALVPDKIVPYLNEQKLRFIEYIGNQSDVQLNFKYAENKWTKRQVIMHIIDTEQVFTYRTLAVSRGDSQNLSGFDQDVYIDNFDSSHLDRMYLKKYFTNTRDAFLSLLEGMKTSDWQKVGKMSHYDMPLNAMPYMIAGHLEHHYDILINKYKEG